MEYSIYNNDNINKDVNGDITTNNLVINNKESVTNTNNVMSNNVMSNNIMSNNVMSNNVMSNNVMSNNINNDSNMETKTENNVNESSNTININNKVTNIVNNTINNTINNNIVNITKNVNSEEKINEDTYNKTLNNINTIQYEFLNANKTKIWPTSIMTSCFWCCHNFKTIPISLPEYYINDKFYLYGTFCSYNCAASYNFSRLDSRTWERYSLLNLLYKKLNNSLFSKIKLAPSKEILKKFGGYMDIEEYRKHLLIQDKKIDMLMLPIISIIPKTEEILNYGSYNTKLNKYIPINNTQINDANKSLKLKKEI